MGRSNFSFVPNTILRENLDNSFEHILTLLPFSESKSYNETAKHAFRKTIIIYTASIVEALLFYVLDTEFSDDDIREHYSVWELKDERVLYVVDDINKIVAGIHRKVLAKVRKDKMNMGQIADFLKDKGVLDDDLYKEIDELRKMRNEQHIGTHKSVCTYERGRLEKAFSVAAHVKEFVRIRIRCL